MAKSGKSTLQFESHTEKVPHIQRLRKSETDIWKSQDLSLHVGPRMPIPESAVRKSQLRVDGLAEIVNDASIKRKLWNEGLRRFIPDDDQVVCIAVTPEKVEFTDPAILSLRPKL
ncbi:hypothetical protein Pelo_294 [Pelomyxa schiedti]|nr:hypothetical protein Pelo_294 [Pelomyxa schiedti]